MGGVKLKLESNSFEMKLNVGKNKDGGGECQIMFRLTMEEV